MKLLWLDLETTGLNPAKDRILEIAVAEATLEDPFNAKHIYHAVLHLPYSEVLDPFILDMHTKNGLLPECYNSFLTASGAEADLLRLVPEVANKDDKSTLAGNSVHFDLGFIRHHMPLLAKRLSHRVYDVSAINLFCQSLGMPKMPKGREPHRAIEDVNASIDQAVTLACWAMVPR